MENLYDYNRFLNIAKSNKIKENHLISLYLRDEISFEEFRTEFKNQIPINEGVLNDWLKKVLDWTLGIFKSIINSPEVYFLKEGGKKAFNTVKSVLDYISKFKQKHPVVYKCIAIFLVIIIIFIATAATAYAGDNTSLPDSVYNMALGLLDSIQSDYTYGKYTDFDFMEAKAYLIKLREHELDQTTAYSFGETSKQLANAAIDTIKQSIDDYNQTHSDSLARVMVNWLEEGSKMVLLKLESIATSGGFHRAIEIGTSGPMPPPTP